MSKQHKFWKWFTRHQIGLFNLEMNREELFDQISVELRKIDPNLTFEFGPKESKREFVISADGIRRAFPAVLSLFKAAPHLEQWTIIAFRPRRLPSGVVKFKDKLVNTDDVQFLLLRDGITPGIYLFLPNFQNGDLVLHQIGYVLLDAALGEYDVEVRLGTIRILSSDTEAHEERHPFKELPFLFDQLINQIEGRSGKPS